MKLLRITRRKGEWAVLALVIAFGIISIPAQSKNIEFPTPVTSNEISGKILARDAGDSRLTTYYYFFNGTQGDMFLTISSSNLDGDIDIFVAESLKPVTKISLYSDGNQETGREIYLRQPEKLILRVEGRTPIDAPATFSIKFAGSFLAAARRQGIEEPMLPEVKPSATEVVKVNSVGTIIKTAPKKAPEKPVVKTTPEKTTAKKSPVKEPIKKPTPKPSVVVKDDTARSQSEKSREDRTNDRKTDTNPPETAAADKKTEEGIADVKPATVKTKLPKTKTPAKKNPPAPVKDSSAKREPAAKKSAEKREPLEGEELQKALENIKLVILFKDGARIERPMTEVVRFSIDKGILTVISKGGSIGRYSILLITRFSVE